MFQQPAAKAVFELTLIIDSQLSALSNMPEASIKSLSNNKKEVHFLPTVKMSTYLLAFVVGEFDFVAVRTRVVYLYYPLLLCPSTLYLYPICHCSIAHVTTAHVDRH
jgi:aminopeptidase N